MADRPLTALALAKEWMALDQDPETRAEIQALLDSQDVDQLELLMSPRIGFGTAGLRGCMEAGFGRMNSLTVIQTSQGLAAYLLNNVIDANKKSVVIGRDHRHNSAKFIDLAAAAFTSMGIEVIYLGMVHTPLVPFTVKTMGATAGVMITASHNTAKDNGLKVYWSNACQIIPPHDAGIAAAIQRNLDPLSWDRDARKTSQLVENNNGKALEEYYKSVQKLVGTLDHSLNAAVFTTMHGVGGHYLTKVIERLIQKPSMPNIESPLIPVPEQVNPDPDFPTVKFPNPEEAGALNMAMKRADKLGIRSVIALDPDGDRFAAAEKLANDTWHQFTGNEMGVLLASYILEVQVPRARSVGNHKPLAMLNSTVSSRMLREMSEFHGFRHVETLTGFKWLGNTAQELERDGYWVPYAFEEAIGYMFTEVGHDKDGVAAAALYLAARAHWINHSDGSKQTPYERLQALDSRYGYHTCANSYLITPSAAVTIRLFDNIRKSGIIELGHSVYWGKMGVNSRLQQAEEAVGVRTVRYYHDVTHGFYKHISAKHRKQATDRDTKYNLPTDPTSQMIQLELQRTDDSQRGNLTTRVTMRGSGTESKIKLYVETWMEYEKESDKYTGETQEDQDEWEDYLRRQCDEEAAKIAASVKKNWFGELCR